MNTWDKLALASASVSIFCAVPALAQQYTQEPVQSTLFSDNFSGGFGNWTVGTNVIDHTIFGQTPTLVTNANGQYSTYAVLKLDTYDPTQYQNGVSFLGTQIQTNQSFSLPMSGGSDTGQGIQFQISARVESTGKLGPQGSAGDTTIPVSEGLNAAAFTYSYSSSQNYHDEIDFENLTSQQQPPSQANPNGMTTHTNSELGTSDGDATLDTSYATTASGGNDSSRYSQYPYEKFDQGATTPSNNIYQWETYDIDWYPNQIDWYINGTLVREEASGETGGGVYIPDEAMPFYLNFWAPGSEFTDAYYSGLVQSATAAGNEEFYYDVADASVSIIAPIGTPTPEPGSAAVAIAIGGLLISRRRKRLDV